MFDAAGGNVNDPEIQKSTIGQFLTNRAVAWHGLADGPGWVKRCPQRPTKWTTSATAAAAAPSDAINTPAAAQSFTARM
jgi:hypothetical protein